jgi:NAD(P)-dependent dehydrogenase (short-subunit alcohol dehydrogenase family)
MNDGVEKVALVTGAGGGSGREIAIQLARRGCRVAVLDINASGTDDTVKLCAPAKGHAFPIVADLTRGNSAPSSRLGFPLHANDGNLRRANSCLLHLASVADECRAFGTGRSNDVTGFIPET